MSSLSFGYQLPTFETTDNNSDRIAAVLELGVAAEQEGFDTVWVPDSPFQYGLPDPLTVLAALAARTATGRSATAGREAMSRPAFSGLTP